MGFPESFEKKIIKKIEYSRSLSDSENYWCGHQQPYNFFPISEHLQITQENQNQLIQSEKIAVTGGKKFLDYLKRKDFYNQLEKIFNLFVQIVCETNNCGTNVCELVLEKIVICGTNVCEFNIILSNCGTNVCE